MYSCLAQAGHLGGLELERPLLTHGILGMPSTFTLCPALSSTVNSADRDSTRAPRFHMQTLRLSEARPLTQGHPSESRMAKVLQSDLHVNHPFPFQLLRDLRDTMPG